MVCVVSTQTTLRSRDKKNIAMKMWASPGDSMILVYFCICCFSSDIHLLKGKLCFMPQINELLSRWKASLENAASHLASYGK